jgi:hypothetical protein
MNVMNNGALILFEPTFSPYAPLLLASSPMLLKEILVLVVLSFLIQSIVAYPIG